MIRWQQAINAQYKLQSGRLSWHPARRAPGRFRSGLACCCIGSAENSTRSVSLPRFSRARITLEKERREAEAECFSRPSCVRRTCSLCVKNARGDGARARWGSVWTRRDAGLFTAFFFSRACFQKRAFWCPVRDIWRTLEILCVKPKDFLGGRSQTICHFPCAPLIPVLDLCICCALKGFPKSSCSTFSQAAYSTRNERWLNK